MNTFEIACKLLELCPVPSCIQQLIFNILVGYGTPSANAIQKETIRSWGAVNEFRYILNYIEQYYNQEVLYELHIIYLTNKRQTSYTISKLQILSQYSQDLTRNRLIRLLDEETKLRLIKMSDEEYV
jgi:hypothetical protein